GRRGRGLLLATGCQQPGSTGAQREAAGDPQKLAPCQTDGRLVASAATWESGPEHGSSSSRVDLIDGRAGWTCLWGPTGHGVVRGLSRRTSAVGSWQSARREDPHPQPGSHAYGLVSYAWRLARRSVPAAGRARPVPATPPGRGLPL